MATTLQTLKKFGIRCGKIKEEKVLEELRGRVFLELDPGRRKLLIWEPKTAMDYSVKIAGSKSFQQAVITVEEKEFDREFHTILDRGEAYFIEHMVGSGLTPIGDDGAIQDLADKEKIAHPELEGEILEIKDEKLVKWRAVIPPSTTSFLVGRDESHYFISALPEPCNSVKAAHEMLIPEEIRGENWLRQGEWFFVKRDLPEKINDFDFYSSVTIDDSDHWTDSLYYDKKRNQYCMGYISHDRHESLFLDGLYQVYRNREVEPVGDRWD